MVVGAFFEKFGMELNIRIIRLTKINLAHLYPLMRSFTLVGR